MRSRDPKRVASLLDKVRGLKPVIDQHREAFDRERRLPERVVDALVDADLLRLWLPEKLGGPELSPIDFMEVVEAVSELDGSVGWIVGNGAGMSRSGGYLPEEVARAWFAGPRSFVVAATGAVGSAVPVTAGYRATGRWPFGSGAYHATRFMGLCAIADGRENAAPQTIACHFGPSDVALIDTWHVSGLRGTGSCDFEVKDVFVPVEHTYKFPDHAATQPGLLYRMPAVSVFAWTVSVVPLGIAKAAIAGFGELAGRLRARTMSPLGESEIVQSEVGRAETLHRAARACLVEAMQELMAATDLGGERLVRARARFRAACAFAAESGIHIVNALAATAGSAAIFEKYPLERCVRDMAAAVKHVAMSPSSYTLAGRLCLGEDPGTARF
jgi:indole-3-acetate monooxygenase